MALRVPAIGWLPKLIVTAFAVVSLHIMPTAAVEIDLEQIDPRPISNIGYYFYISGEIKVGDTEKVKSYVESHATVSPRNIAFHLGSPG